MSVKPVDDGGGLRTKYKARINDETNENCKKDTRIIELGSWQEMESNEKAQSETNEDED